MRRSLLPTEEGLHTAVAKAIKFFEGSREPFALLWLAVMHRRFKIHELAYALPRFDEVLSEQPKQLPLLRVFRRMADDENPLRVDDLDAVSHPSDRIVVCALYCDRLELPRSFPDVLDKAVRAGGYYLTHALLAWIWARERGCDLALGAGFVDTLHRANAAMIDSDATTVTDVKLEAAAFLYMAGKGALVDDVFVETVVATQRADGGWGLSRNGQGDSDWHATILGLMLLLHVKSAAS